MNNKELLNSYKEKLNLIQISSEIYSLVDDVVKDLESLTYAINDKQFVNIFIIPDTSEQFEKLSLLQFTSIINFSDFLKKNPLVLFKLLNKVNQSLPIGCILVNSDNQILFKYIFTTIINEPVDDKLFEELIYTINNIIVFNENLLSQDNEIEIENILNKI
jgi:hypothetical protein